MPRSEKYFIGPQLLGDIRRAVGRVDSDSLGGGGGGGQQTQLQGMRRPPRSNRYFRITEPLAPCFSAEGDEVYLANKECLEFEDAPGGLKNVEVFDVNNAVRVYNLVTARLVDSSAGVGTVVEAAQEFSPAGDDSLSYWKILQVMSCECDSSSSSSSSSSSESSSSSSSSSSEPSSESSEPSSESSEPSSSGVCNSTIIGGIDLSSIPTGSAASLIGIDGNGCLVRIETTECGSSSSA